MKYIQLPDFTVDGEWSAWEGETMHGVRDLPSGTYCETYAVRLMQQIIARYLKNVAAAGADVDFHRRALAQAIDADPSSGQGS